MNELCEVGDRVGIGNVDSVGEHLAAQFSSAFARLLEAVRIEIAQSEVGPARGEGERAGAPDPRAGSGDQGPATVEASDVHVRPLTAPHGR